MACVETDAPQVDALPSVDALIAGAVALMPAWADPCPPARLAPADLRRVLARKVVSNLFFLQRHPQAGPELRQSLAQAHARWVGLAQQAQPGDVVLTAAEGQSLH